MPRVLFSFVILCAFIIMLGPIVVVVGLSFSSEDSLVFPPAELSLRWFTAFFGQDKIFDAFVFSLQLALFTMVGSAIFGVLGALAVVRMNGIVASLLQALFIAPLVFPTIVLGLSLLLFVTRLNLFNVTGLFIAHLIVGLPYTFRTMLASLQSFDNALVDAAQSLGAGPIRAFFYVTFPIIWPGIFAGAVFAFIISLGELNTALFLSSPGLTTLPIEILSTLSFPGNQLIVAAASSIQIVLIVALLLVVERLIGAGRLART